MENKKKKIVLNIILLVVGLALIIFGVIKISGGPKNNLTNKFNEIQNLSNKASDDMQVASDLLLGISDKENLKDYAGAAKDIKTSISKLDDATSKVNSLNSKTVEFKKTVEAVTDSTVKESGLRWVNLIIQRSTIVLKLISNSKQLVEPAKAYYEALAAGKAGTYLTDNQVYNLTQEINKDKATLMALATQIDAANQDLAKAVGFQLKTIE